MYCQYCGGQLPDDANYCGRCGKPSAEARQAADPPAETCEIVAEMVGEKRSPLFPADMLRFTAKAEGPEGAYTAGESAAVRAGLSEYYQPNQKNKRHVKALEELAAALAGDGWERAGRGARWYSLRFRRRLP